MSNRLGSARASALAVLVLSWSVVACGAESGSSGAGGADVIDDGGNLGGADAKDGAGARDSGGGDSGASDSGGGGDSGGGDSGVGDSGVGDSGGGDSGGGADGSVGDSGGGIPSAWTACESNSDCVAVELACCDHCNGGKLGGFHKTHAAAAKQALGQAPCDGVACTEKACGSAIARCEAGACAAGPDPAFGGGCAALTEAQCGKTPSCQPIFASTAASACSGGKPVAFYQGCGNANQGCGDALTCAIDPKTDKKWVFSSTCVAEGYKVVSFESCCPSSGGTCGQGAAATLAKFCLQPQSGVGGLQPGAAFDVVMWPQGCMSSSCTTVHSASCSAAVDASGALVIAGAICLEDTGGGGPCTADCGGGGFAKCAAPKLEKGTYVAKLGGLSLSFAVPSPPEAQLCAGAQW